MFILTLIDKLKIYVFCYFNILMCNKYFIARKYRKLIKFVYEIRNESENKDKK